MPPKLTTKSFIEKARAVHGNKYDYSRVVYALAKNPVVIVCPTHGEFKQSPNTHVSGGAGCPLCYTLQHEHTIKHFGAQFIERAIVVHGPIYDYSDAVYTGASDKLDIICPTHGTFQQNANKHLLGSGCPQCSRIQLGKKVNSQLVESFIAKAMLVHSSVYDYSPTIYLSARHKVQINCRIHGVFEQRPNHHLRCNSCTKCAQDSHAERTGGYSKSNWAARQHGRKAILYLLRLSKDAESFYKIGRTFCLADRITHMHKHYSTEVLSTLCSESANFIWDKERDILRKLKTLKYLPKEYFAGRHECLREDEIVLSAFNSLL